MHPTNPQTEQIWLPDADHSELMNLVMCNFCRGQLTVLGSKIMNIVQPCCQTMYCMHILLLQCCQSFSAMILPQIREINRWNQAPWEVWTDTTACPGDMWETNTAQAKPFWMLPSQTFFGSNSWLKQWHTTFDCVWLIKSSQVVWTAFSGLCYQPKYV